MTDMRNHLSSPPASGVRRDVHRWKGPRVRQAVVFAVDAVLLLVVIQAVVYTRVQPSFLWYGPGPFVWESVIVIWLVMLAVFGTYAAGPMQFGPDEYSRVFFGSAMTAGIVGITCYLAELDVSRSAFVLAFVIGTPVLLIGRLGRRRILNRLHNSGVAGSPVVVAGAPDRIDEIVAVLRREKWLGYRVVGALTPQADSPETDSGLPVLGSVNDVATLVDDLDLYAVIFTEGAFPSSAHFRRTAWELEQHKVEMIVAPGLTDISAQRISPRPVAGLPLVFIQRPQALKAGRWVKRLFDIVGSALLLLLTAPLLAIVALAVKLEDRGPILFRQIRVGLHGEQFHCLKIRSMCVDAEARLAALAAQNEGAGPLFKMTNDPRITRVGRFIRRFSLDEFPQLWNVLRGDMSLVGPRPALPAETAQYDFDASRRLHVRPGLTGLWQVSGRSNLSWSDTVRLDLYYIDNWSLTQDLMILARTVKAVLGKDGAY